MFKPRLMSDIIDIRLGEEHALEQVRFRAPRGALHRVLHPKAAHAVREKHRRRELWMGPAEFAQLIEEQTELRACDARVFQRACPVPKMGPGKAESQLNIRTLAP